MQDKMKINVKAKHIKAGKRGSSCNCAIALAINEATGEICSVHDSVDIYEQGLLNMYRHYVLSRAARRFINKFDKHGKKSCKPFSFILRKG